MRKPLCRKSPGGPAAPSTPCRRRPFVGPGTSSPASLPCSTAKPSADGNYSARRATDTTSVTARSFARPAGAGNLLSEKQYADFILRFEFKLEKGSNNGLAIRSPLQATNLAYDGMELQIIDNSAERYRDIHPWQKRHGSLYHVFPAKPGFFAASRQVEQPRGRRPRKACQGNPERRGDSRRGFGFGPRARRSSQSTPALAEPRVHIGFLGHGEPIGFRKIRIKVL